MKNVLFLTGTDLMSNPRLVKELRLVQSGVRATVVTFRVRPDHSVSNGIAASFGGIRVVTVSALRGGFSWWVASLLQRIFDLMWRVFPDSLFLSAASGQKRTLQLLMQPCLWARKWDYVIAHTLGTVFVAQVVARRCRCPFAFDMEDYHPGEFHGEGAANEVRRSETVLRQLLPRADYVSFASPLFEPEMVRLTGGSLKATVTVLNCFSKEEFEWVEPPSDGKLRFVWFSLTVGPRRGLEALFPVLSRHSDKFELWLFGKPEREFVAERRLESQGWVRLVDACSQRDLHRQLCEFDIGLAFEDPAVERNRTLCVTNKIVAYCQAGLYVLATGTDAQVWFLGQYPEFGRVMEGSLEQALLALHAMRGELRRGKAARFEAAAALSWESQQQRLMEVWRRLNLLPDESGRL